MNKIGASLAIVAIVLSAMLVGTVTGIWSPVTMMGAWQEKISPEEKLPFETIMAIEEGSVFSIQSAYSRHSVWSIVKVENITDNGCILSIYPDIYYQDPELLFVGNTTSNYMVEDWIFAMSCKKETADNKTFTVISVKEMT